MEIRYRYYTEGNTVRREAVTAVPGIIEQPEVRPQSEERPAHKLNLSFTVLLTAAAVLFAWACFTYLSVQADIRSSLSHIYAMENQLAEAKAANDVAENRMDAQVNLEEIYRIATEELGMVYPDGNEKILYRPQIREYVRQYEDIPNN